MTRWRRKRIPGILRTVRALRADNPTGSANVNARNQVTLAVNWIALPAPPREKRVRKDTDGTGGLGTASAGARVLTFPSQDDVQQRRPAPRAIEPYYGDLGDKRRLVRLAAFALYVACAVIYLGWRTTIFNPSAPVFSAVFYAAEVYGFAMSLLIVMTAWRRKRRDIVDAPRGLSVDVFIPTYNEPLNVIRRTVLGAVNIEYPHETWVLDDGNRPEVAALAAEFGCRYLARTSNEGAKAGNLNNGLREATGDFVAIFDADHVAQKDFLDRLLGYFADEKIALVQTPQDYFNLDSFQHGRGKRRKLIWHEQSFFHYVGQPGRDHWNAATFCGCSAIIRRSALDEIGGFPSVTVTEDMHAAVQLQKRGYDTAFHSEPLAFGIAPSDFLGFSRQRLRWGEGNMQVCREEGIPFTRDLTVAQRLCYFALTATYLDGWQKAIYYAAPIIVLFTQVPPIWSDPIVFLAFFVPYMVATYLYYEEFGRGFGNIFATEAYAMARVGAAIVSTFGLVRKRIQFRISSKELSGRMPFMAILPQLLVFAGGLGGIAFTILRPWIGMPLYMPTGLTLIIAALAAVNCALAAWVIRDAWRSSRAESNNYSHPIPLPVELRNTRGDIDLVEIDSISVDRFSFLADDGSFVAVGDTYSGRLFLPGGQILFEAEVTERTPAGTRGVVRVRCAFRGLSPNDQDAIDLALHAGRWHRPLLGHRESIRTPSEFLKDLLTTGSMRAPSPLTWEAAVYQRQAGRTDDVSVCFLAKDPGSPHSILMLIFGDLSPGTVLHVTPAGQQPEFSKSFRIGAQQIGVMFDEAALDVVDGRIYTLSKVRDTGAVPAHSGQLAS